MINSKRFYAIKKITNIYRIYRKESEQKFSIRQVIDIFSGLDESLKLAKQRKLHKLYSRILNRIKGFFYQDIILTLSFNYLNCIDGLCQNVNEENKNTALIFFSYITKSDEIIDFIDYAITYNKD